MKFIQAVEEHLHHPNYASCHQDITQSLLTAIEDVSPYARAYYCMAEVEQEENLQAIEEGGQAKPVTIFFKRGQDQQWYNNRAQDYISTVFVGQDLAPPGFMDSHTVVHPHFCPCEWHVDMLTASLL